MTGSKRVDYRTSGTVYEYSEIAGPPQSSITYGNTSIKRSPSVLFDALASLRE
jgi:hypothetical protein